MKKLSYLLIIPAACFFVACGTKKEETKGSTATGGMSEKATKNLATSRAIGKAFETNDLASIDSLVSPDFVDHNDRGEMNRDSLKAMITQMHKTNTNMKTEIIKELADDDYVMAWMRFTGNHDGSMMKAGPYNITAIQTTKFKDGKAIEHWEFMEPGEMMQMMPPPPPPSKANEKKVP